MASSPREVTALLLAWRGGDAAALETLIPVIYQELRRIARRYMVREHSAHALQATALVHEVYLRLIDGAQVDWQNRAHFFAVAANLMRRILVDYARSRNYVKRGGQAQHVSLDDSRLVSTEQPPDLLALDDALNSLAVFDARKSRVVELRFFGGLTVEETASVLDVSSRTVMADWCFAKAWLLRELGGNTAEQVKAND